MRPNENLFWQKLLKSKPENEVINATLKKYTILSGFVKSNSTV